MGFNSRILNDVKKLDTILKESGSTYFFKTQIKGIDSFKGTNDSIEFIEKFINLYNETDKEFHQLDE